MSKNVWYTERFGLNRRTPIAGATWLRDSQARVLFESGKGVEVVDAAAVVDGHPQQRWILGWAGKECRANFYDEHGTLRRLVDYEHIDGRLWRWVTVDYTYPDHEKRWDEDEAILTVQAAVRPDGTGNIEISDFESGTEHLTEFTDIETESFWTPMPEFGAWDDLVAPGPSASEIGGVAATQEVR